MEHIHGDAEAHGSDGIYHSEAHLRSGSNPSDDPESTLHVLGDIARGSAANALYTSTNRLKDAFRSAEERTHIVSFARSKPLTALGAAFGVGFILAAATEAKEGNRHVERIRRRLRAALISTVAAAIASATPAISGPGGMVDELGDWLDRRNGGANGDPDYDDEDDEYDEEPDF